MISRFEIITTSIRPSTTSMTSVSGGALTVSAPAGVTFLRIMLQRVLAAERRLDQMR